MQLIQINLPDKYLIFSPLQYNTILYVFMPLFYKILFTLYYNYLNLFFYEPVFSYMEKNTLFIFLNSIFFMVQNA